ncbi:MAG: Na+/H+ antiporter NhaC [Clostridiales bacterium]|nr:Na+/H+ antiporter NhaC [Clostridiales bacterium]MDD6389412.1 Na+/H+ antiporter NhaC [Bacillota bacterium]MDY5976084.1 Na+/H+ antiporter NhaC [Anaerovoracaceae bacterium]
MVKEKKPDRQPRQPKVYHALIVFGVLIAIMSVGIIVYGSNVHVPMFCGVIAAALMALWLGFKWETIEKAMMDGIYNALQAAIILMIVGVLIGVWIVSGVVPAMIYYGLKLLSPSIFLVAAVLICSVTSLATGTSWGTMGTMGLALMGIAVGLDIPAPMAAGAIISGAYFGDKMSPLSDTTNLAPAMAGTDVMTHVKFMLLPTGIAYGLTLIIFGILGGIYVHSGNAADMSAVSDMSGALASEFCLSPVLLLPPLIVILAVAFKIPAIPGITLGIIAGALLGPVFQGADCGLGVLLEAGMSGYVSDTGIEAIDSLLTTGGIENMLSSVSLTLIAMMFGGIMEKTGQLEVVVNRIIALAKSPAALVGTTELTCVLSNATMPEQYISIVVPGRMYAEAYREQGLHPKTLSNALESSGTVTSALIPWNTCGVFIFATLGISTVSYLPFAFFNWLMPVITFALACAGLTVAGADGKRLGRKGKVRKQIPETTEER